MMNHYQRSILSEAIKYGGTNISKNDQMARVVESNGIAEARKMGKKQLEKAANDAFRKYFDRVQVSIMKLGAIYKDIEAAIVSGADLDKVMPELIKKYGIAEAYAPLDTKGIVGAFTEATYKKRFEYRNSTDSWGKSHGLPHEVCVSYGGDRKEQWRSANVKGTVCYIAVDEGADGKPVMEKWAIRNHVKYVKAESVEVADLLNKKIDEEFTQQNAQTIKQQLGGGKFVAMTGAKDFMFSGKDSYLSFKIGKGAKDGINYIKIIYNQGKDDYTVEFCVFRGTNVTVKHRAEGVYADQLREIFQKHTGLYTSLGTMGSRKESVEVAEAAAPATPTHGYKVGDILFGSTYYGMIIPHFYKVMRIIGTSKIEVVELVLQQNGDGWSGQATPSGTPKSAAKIFTVRKSGGADPGIKINNYLTAQKWDGRAAMYNYLD